MDFLDACEHTSEDARSENEVVNCFQTCLDIVTLAVLRWMPFDALKRAPPA